jgi:hypothetical protein
LWETTPYRNRYVFSRCKTSGVHLYGHVHAGDSSFLQEYFGKCYCVGVESNAYAPVSIEEIIERMEKVPQTGLLDEFYQEHKVSVWNQVGKAEEREEGTERAE